MNGKDIYLSPTTNNLMDNFLTKQILLEKEKELPSDRVRINNIGLLSWKRHSFLSPEENRELTVLCRLCVDNGLIDSIGTTVSSLVVRNMMSDLDYKFEKGRYHINREVDSDRKTHIIYGFGVLDGKIPKEVHINVHGIYHKDETEHDGYFHWFEPFIIVNRNDEAMFMFNNSPEIKIYGMTCESLGANVAG